MKLKVKTFALTLSILGATPAFAQLTVEQDANSKTNGFNDGIHELTYNFQEESKYTLMTEGKKLLLEGTGDKVNLGVLTPGVYFMLYEKENGKAILDRFEITR